MAENIENLAEKTEQLSMDSIYDTNWCDLPADIKLECIGKMELKERLSLRCTSKTENALVDSKKMNFVEGEFRWDYLVKDWKVLLKSENGILYTNKFEDKTEACDFTKYIFKIGIFENLKFDSSDFLAKQIANSELQISAKSIDFVRSNCEDMLFILEKTKRGVESIKIEPFGEELDYMDFPMKKVLDNPNIQNSRFWEMRDCTQPWFLTELAKIWINKNSEIGTTVQTSLKVDGASQHFSNQFKDRVLSVSDKRIRIKTNNPATHILLERGLLGMRVWDSCLQFFRLSVISAGMKESDYEENHKEWIRKMCPWLPNENVPRPPELEELMNLLVRDHWQ